MQWKVHVRCGIISECATIPPSEVRRRADAKLRAAAGLQPLSLFGGSSPKVWCEASMLQTAPWTPFAPPFLSPISQAFLGHTAPLGRNTRHHCGPRRWGSNRGQRLQMAAPAALQVHGGRWGTGCWGLKRQQQCWQRIVGRDSKALPKNIEQFFSSEAISTENSKMLDHTLHIEKFLQHIWFWLEPSETI